MNKYREEFEKKTGYHWINSQGEPDIDYVDYLESKLEQAEKEVRIKQSTNESYAKTIMRQSKTLEQAEKEKRELVKNLALYGNHTVNCSVMMGGDNCDCGWYSLLGRRVHEDKNNRVARILHAFRLYLHEEYGTQLPTKSIEDYLKQTENSNK